MVVTAGNTQGREGHVAEDFRSGVKGDWDPGGKNSGKYGSRAQV